MKLTHQQKIRLKSFFNNQSSMVWLFEMLFDYQDFLCCGRLEFDDRGDIIGFGLPGEYLRAYCISNDDSYSLKFRATSTQIILTAFDYQKTKKMLLANHLIFEQKKAEFLVKDTISSKASSKNNSKGETDKESRYSSLAKKILNCLDKNQGLKAKEIAYKTNEDRAHINSCLYGELKEVCYQDYDYCWYIGPKNDTNVQRSDNKKRKNALLQSNDKYACLLIYVKNKKISFDKITEILNMNELNMSQMEEIALYLEKKDIKVIY